eukprot:1587092-Rhodomonas_salina.1
MAKYLQALEMVRTAAGTAGVAVAMGYAERTGASFNQLGGGQKMYNAVKVWHADGTEAFSYRKIFLFGEREKRLCVPGTKSGWRAFQLRLKEREVQCGVCICYDTERRPRLHAPSHGRTLLLELTIARLASSGDDWARVVDDGHPSSEAALVHLLQSPGTAMGEGFGTVPVFLSLRFSSVDVPSRATQRP